MTLPGTRATISEEAVPRYAPPNTATWFVVGMTERGPGNAPILVRSLAEAVQKAGDSVAYGAVNDALDVFFREGGSQAYIGRVLGPNPVKASGTLYDQSGSTSGDKSITATAKEYGSWHNGLNVEAIYATSTVQFVVTHDNDPDTVLETSPIFSTKADAVAWQSAYVTLTAETSSELPRSQTVSLAGGTDDHSSATETEWAAALDLFDADIGPGQVSAPGRTTQTTRQALAAHALERNRIALLDADDTAVVADVAADAADVTGEDGDRFSAMLWPWATVPGVLGGTDRTVPYCAVQAGLIARSEAAGNGPNAAAAGPNGVARYATGLSQAALNDADRETLNDAGVIVARQRLGVIQTYGYRTLADPDSDPDWVQLTGSRTVMAIKANMLRVADEYLYAQLDGRGIKIAAFGGDLAAVCAGFYDSGALYGATPDDAYSVDVSAAVNTPESIAAGYLKARVALRISPFAERVEIDIHRVRLADAV